MTPVIAAVWGATQCHSAQASTAFCKSVLALKPLWGIKRGGISGKLQGVYLYHKSCLTALVTLKVDTSDYLGHFASVFFCLKWSPCGVQVAGKNHILLLR